MARRPKILVVLGTRPEAIKLAPVLRRLRRRACGLSISVASTGQHASLLGGMLKFFDIRPDYSLGLMRSGQSPGELLQRALRGLHPLLDEERPDLLVVQGDTTTALAGALAASRRSVPVAHVEAGLRSFDPRHPYPEEIHRLLIDRLSPILFAPTPLARRHLAAEGLGGRRVLVTGNTAVDALYFVGAAKRSFKTPALRALPKDRKLVLVTLHRRELFGRPLEGILRALRRAARAHNDAHFIFPVHPNPALRGPIRRLLRHRRILLSPPLPYLDMIGLLQRVRFLITDSGGLQEEAPSFGRPVLVVRRATERPELIGSGGGLLIGTDPKRLLRETGRLLRDDAHWLRMSRAPNPFGDGRAARRITAALLHHFGLGPKPRPWRPSSPRY